NWISATIFKLEKMRDSVIAFIRFCDDEIQKCNETAVKSENLKRLAIEKGNSEVEKVATTALVRAKNALSINTDRKNAAVLNKKRIELSITALKNQVLNIPESSNKATSVITNYSGNINLKKKNGEIISFGNDQPLFLDKGDEISTLDASTVELVFFEGRGSLNIGENSIVCMEEDSAGTPVMKMIQGKVNISIEKFENYMAAMQSKINAYREDLKFVKDEFKQNQVDEYDMLIKKGRAYFQRKLQVITPAAICGIRGTQLLVYEDRNTGTEIIVLEGSIEMKGKKGEKTIIVDAGYKGSVSIDGVITGPQIIDVTTIDQWWK
ncbi:MAG: hypothetical protein WBC06_19225, partial [Chitinophagaceae bacterium]